jgi:hypothetical protein
MDEKPDWVPEGYTYQQAFEIIEMVISRLERRHKFGYHQDVDMHQEGWLHCIRILRRNKYDHARPLEKFLYVHVRNKFLNMKRDQYHRANSPCERCPLYTDDISLNNCLKFQDKSDCRKYKNWEDSNISKRNLMNLIGLDIISDEHEANTKFNSNIVGSISRRETEDIIEESLPSDMLEDFRKLINAERLSKKRISEIRAEVRFILNDFEIYEDQECPLPND